VLLAGNGAQGICQEIEIEEYFRAGGGVPGWRGRRDVKPCWTHHGGRGGWRSRDRRTASRSRLRTRRRSLGEGASPGGVRGRRCCQEEVRRGYDNSLNLKYFPSMTVVFRADGRAREARAFACPTEA
jgi:hypothetical protein